MTDQAIIHSSNVLNAERRVVATRTSVWALTAVAAVTFMMSSAVNKAAAAPLFTLNPSAIVGVGAAFTGTSLTLNDFSTVKFSGPAAGGGISFTESGYLPVVSVAQGVNTVNTPGLTTDYSIYFFFTGSGTQDSANVTGQITNGSFQNLSLSLFVASGATTFGFNSTTNNPVILSGNAGTLVALGGLLAGGDNFVSTRPSTTGARFAPSAGVTTTVSPVLAQAAFFAQPNPFYSTEMSTFINLSDQINPLFTGNTVSGFQINAAGGGVTNFVATAVPEPASLFLLGASLAMVGLVRRRLS